MDEWIHDGPVPASVVAPGIIEALGLPSTTTFLQITLGMSGPAEVTCRYFPDAEAMQRCAQVLQQYRVVQRERSATEVAEE